MPQITQIQGSNINQQDAQLASATLGMQLADMKKRQSTQAQQLSGLRTLMMTKPEKFKNGESVIVDEYNDTKGNDLFYQSLAGKKQDLEALNTKAGDIGKNGKKIGETSYNIHEDNIGASVNAVLADNARLDAKNANAKAAVGSIQASLAASDGQIATGLDMLDQVQQRTDVGKDLEAVTQKVAGAEKMSIAEVKDLVGLSDEEAKALNPDEADRRKALTESLKSIKIGGSKVDVEKNAKLGIKEEFREENTGAKINSKNSFTTTTDHGIAIKDEIKQSTADLNDLANFQNIASGYDPVVMQNNTYSKLAAAREAQLASLAALERGRLQVDTKQGEFNVTYGGSNLSASRSYTPAAQTINKFGAPSVTVNSGGNNTEKPKGYEYGNENWAIGDNDDILVGDKNIDLSNAKSLEATKPENMSSETWKSALWARPGTNGVLPDWTETEPGSKVFERSFPTKGGTVTIRKNANDANPVNTVISGSALNGGVIRAQDSSKNQAGSGVKKKS